MQEKQIESVLKLIAENMSVCLPIRIIQTWNSILRLVA